MHHFFASGPSHGHIGTAVLLPFAAFPAYDFSNVVYVDDLSASDFSRLRIHFHFHKMSLPCKAGQLTGIRPLLHLPAIGEERFREIAPLRALAHLRLSS